MNRIGPRPLPPHRTLPSLRVQQTLGVEERLANGGLCYRGAMTGVSEHHCDLLLAPRQLAASTWKFPNESDSLLLQLLCQNMQGSALPREKSPSVQLYGLCR